MHIVSVKKENELLNVGDCSGPACPPVCLPARLPALAASEENFLDKQPKYVLYVRTSAQSVRLAAAEEEDEGKRMKH